MWRCDNVGGLGEHVKKHLLWFLRYTFFNFLLYSSARTEPTQVDRFWRSIRHTTCFWPRMCLFGVSFVLLPILGVKSLILGAWIDIFQLNVQNIKICILSKLLHQVLYVGGPNTRKTNPRWRTAAILKYRKLAISLERFDRSSRNLVRRRILGLWTGSEVEIFTFWKFKMADGRHLEKSKIGHITGTVWPIFSKSGSVMQIGPLDWTRS